MAASEPTAEREEAIGLHLDMLDVDQLREFARLLLIHGGDVTNWASEMHVASKLQTWATCIEKTVRDVGTLRAQVVEKDAYADAKDAELRRAYLNASALEADLTASRAQVVEKDAEIVKLKDQLAQVAWETPYRWLFVEVPEGMCVTAVLLRRADDHVEQYPVQPPRVVPPGAQLEARIHDGVAEVRCRK